MNTPLPLPLPGAYILDPNTIQDPFSGIANTPDEWRSVFTDSLLWLQRFLASRNPYSILARTSSLVVLNESYKQQNTDWFTTDYSTFRLLGQPELEFLQVLILCNIPINITVPTSPKNTERFIDTLTKCKHAFLQQLTPPYPSDPEKNTIIEKLRSHTVNYRNCIHSR